MLSVVFRLKNVSVLRVKIVLLSVNQISVRAVMLLRCVFMCVLCLVYDCHVVDLILLDRIRILLLVSVLF